MHVFGPETHMTAIVGMALGKRPVPKTQNLELPTSTFGLPKVGPWPQTYNRHSNRLNSDLQVYRMFFLSFSFADVPFFFSVFSEWSRTGFQGQHTTVVPSCGGHTVGTRAGGSVETSQAPLHTRNTGRHLRDAAQSLPGDAGL